MSLNNIDLAKDYLSESKIRLDTAEIVISKNAYAFSVRQSQEAVELSSKAALRLLGLDFPKWHDVSDILSQESERFPNAFQKVIPKLAAILSSLTKKREPAMYGDEDNKLSPSKLFDKKDAESALNGAKFCVKSVEDLFALIDRTISEDDPENNEK